MKKWNAPVMEELSISCTEQGKNFSTTFDEVRVDQDGNYWYSFSSGVAADPKLNGTVTRH